MSADSVAWVLNLDAELELDRAQAWLAKGHPIHTLGYVTPNSIRELINNYGQRFASLLPPRALILRDDALLPEVQRSAGMCWCPTPSAIARLQRAGAKPVASPAFEVVLKVNHRRYCAELGQTLPSARFVETLADMNELLRSQSPTGAWLCKRPLGFSGRGQRRIKANDPMRSDDQRWVIESLPHGGLQIEPYVSIVTEYSIHGLVIRDKQYNLGRVCEQRVDQHRAWSSAELTDPARISEAEAEQLQREAGRVATALADEGYFGPFSLDAYTWQDSAGNMQLNPRSEINARMTMAYPIGMGHRWLEELRLALED